MVHIWPPGEETHIHLQVCSAAGCFPWASCLPVMWFPGEVYAALFLAVTWNVNYGCSTVNQFWQGPEHKTAFAHANQCLCSSQGHLIQSSQSGCSLFCVCWSQRGSRLWGQQKTRASLLIFRPCLYSLLFTESARLYNEYCKMASKSVLSAVMLVWWSVMPTKAASVGRWVPAGKTKLF